MLMAGTLGRVQAAVDVHNRFALARELPRLLVRQAVRVREPLSNLSIVVELVQIIRRRDHRIHVRAALRRLAGLEQPDGLARRRQLLEVRD